MNDTPAKCPRCGAPLPAGAPEGLCPRCLLALNLDPTTGLPGDTATSAKQPAQALPVSEVAKLFPQLEIVRLLGQGGMGAVYLARQPSLDRLVALKILHAPAVTMPNFAERFTREARALAKLNHPNIVTVHDFGEAGGRYYLLMEFVDGVTLRDLLQTKKITPAEALTIVPKICDALQFAHEHGIVHRDIKPENILLDRHGRVKIADFGIAKLVGEPPAAGALTGEQDRVGTPHYMAPEQVEQSRAVDHRADIFSLGVVFYEMLTGELPLGRFDAPSQRVRIDVRLDEVVLHALEKEPARRYQQASEVRTAVETIASTPEAARTTSSPGARPVEGIASLTPEETEAFTREVLARDYHLDVLHCFRRSWALIRRDFWPMIGVTALPLLVLSATSGPNVQISNSREHVTTNNGGASILYFLIYVPLVSGLGLYYLRKIRGLPVSMDTLFSGFTRRFVPLLLGGLVSFLLTLLGFFCLVLPGIYLFVAWIFTLTLIIDKRLDFWPAMNLSRKIVNKHWWKIFALVALVFLVSFSGLLGLIVGIFVTTPIAWLAATFAYEDIFGDTPAAARPPGAPSAAYF